jgi:hypothetical protein
MHDPMDDIARQARQGSVAAIIQTLNGHLADCGVRTRAVFAEGVLQLLCEATAPEQLDRPILVAQIRQILEGITPRNIRRVKINSRLVREQQLLWLEEISRDPDNQLLWSEEIVLAQPSFLKQLVESLRDRELAPRKKPILPKVSSHPPRETNTFWYGIASGVSLCLLLGVVGWLLYKQLALQVTPQLSLQLLGTTGQSPSASTASPTPSPTPDPFAEAVRLAEQAAAAGQTVQTSAQWLDLAAKWERASDLMNAVKPEDERYETAQDRVIQYRKNSEAAQAQAKRSRS